MRLNIGCGRYVEPGWVGMESDPTMVAEVKRRGGECIHHDATKPFPANITQVNTIFCEDLIEHLGRVGAHSFLCECLRVLKPGGRLTVSTPDLRLLAVKYLGGALCGELDAYNDDVGDNPDDGTKRDGQFAIVHEAEALNCAFYWWGHKWLYDWPYLEAALLRAGFAEVVYLGEEGSMSMPVRRRGGNLIVSAAKAKT